MSTLITRMENTSARVATNRTNEFVFGIMITVAASATQTTRTLTVWLVIEGISFSSEQSGRLHGEDQSHRRIQREIRYFREQRLAEVVGQAHQQRADRGAAEAAHAADDHDCERERQHLEIKAGVNAEEGAADHPAERRQKRAEREDEHGDAGGVDAHPARH